MNSLAFPDPSLQASLTIKSKKKQKSTKNPELNDKPNEIKKKTKKTFEEKTKKVKKIKAKTNADNFFVEDDMRSFGVISSINATVKTEEYDPL